jgi:hypothetical protein
MAVNPFGEWRWSAPMTATERWSAALRQDDDPIITR